MESSRLGRGMAAGARGKPWCMGLAAGFPRRHVRALILEPVNVALFRKRFFADAIKLRT